MIKLFLKTALRNLKRTPLNTVINIVGLSLGFAVALVSTLWILKQFSFNHYYKNYDTIHQLMMTGTFNNEKSTDGTSTPIPLAKVLESDFKDEIQDVTLITDAESKAIKMGDKKLNATGFYAMGKFSELFSLEAIQGNIATPTAASTVIISESLANRLSETSDVIGKTIQLNGKEQYTIQGIFRDIPENNTFHKLEYVLPFVDYLRKNEGIERWSNCFFSTYGKIADTQNIRELEHKLTSIFRTNLTDINPEILLHPMSKWNLYDSFKNGKNAGGADSICMDVCLDKYIYSFVGQYKLY